MNEKGDKNPKSFKVVLLGDSGVGKTSILNRFTKGTFADNLISTAGACFSSKILEYPELNENLETFRADFTQLNENCKLDVIYNLYNL